MNRERSFDVLRMITRLNVGGPARQALLLTRELSPRWSTLLVAGSPAPEEGELADPDVIVHRVPLVRPLRPQVDVQAFRATRRLLREVRPRIVHTHMAKAGAIGRAASRGTGVRTIHTFHGHVLEGYFRPSVQRAFLEMERRLARSTDVLVAISPEIRDALLDLGVGAPAQYRVIPLGFDLSEHLTVASRSMKLRSRLGLDRNVPLVGIVGRLVPIKDLRTFLRAVRLLPAVHAAILGDGEERSALEGFVNELGIGDRVHFTGWWMDIPAAMSDLDCVVLTSLNEGTPVSLIEALACARPVVATRVGGVGFVVEHDRTGLLVPPGDPAAVATQISRLLASPETASRFAKEGRAFVRSRFHKDRLVADIEMLYNEVTGPSKGAGNKPPPV